MKQDRWTPSPANPSSLPLSFPHHLCLYRPKTQPWASTGRASTTVTMTDQVSGETESKVLSLFWQQSCVYIQGLKRKIQALFHFLLQKAWYQKFLPTLKSPKGYRDPSQLLSCLSVSQLLFLTWIFYVFSVFSSSWLNIDPQLTYCHLTDLYLSSLFVSSQLLLL